MVYQPGIPTGRVPLLSDYLNVQGNFQQLDTTFGVDHTLFSNNTVQNGYHTSVHMIPQATPANAPGFGQIYTSTTNDGIASDQQLFYQTGTGNNNIKLTRNFLPTLASNGATFLPGGLILNWGKATINFSGSFTTITFTQKYITAVYSITFGVISAGGPSPTTNNAYITTATPPTLTGFTVSNTSGASIASIYWMAIGI